MNKKIRRIKSKLARGEFIDACDLKKEIFKKRIGLNIKVKENYRKYDLEMLESIMYEKGLKNEFEMIITLNNIYSEIDNLIKKSEC